LSQKIPQHVAIVMDGNGRWAESRGLERIEGHRAGVDAVKTMVKFCLEKRIAVLSLFAFSRKNWARPLEEVEFLMQLFITALANELSPLNEQGVRIQFMGDRSRLSTILCDKMFEAEALTQHHEKLILNIALNYTGRWDIVQATKQLIQRVSEGSLSLDDVNETALEQCLCTCDLPPPDLLIRTSGEKRISDFFLWQLAFTELYFTDINWPDFSAEEFERALFDYSHRERRYGLISQQLGSTQN
jgi:undecaprenyl diphosphate synthase